MRCILHSNRAQSNATASRVGYRGSARRAELEEEQASSAARRAAALLPGAPMAQEHGECEPRCAAAAQLRAACPEPLKPACVAAARHRLR